MAEWVVPSSWIRLRSWEQLERYRDKGGLILILDEPTISHYHHPACDDVAEHHFETKRANGWKTGAYFWIPDASAAVGYATGCGNCCGQAG